MSLPLLELQDARIDVEGKCVLDGVTLSTSGERVGLLGQGRFLFDALGGAAEVVAGTIRVRGIELEEARQGSLFAVARPWPARSNVTLRDGLILSALLGGCSSSAAKIRADAALEALGIAPLGRQKLVRRPKVEHYLAGLAEAALFDPNVVVVDWPVGLLEAEGWARFGTVLSRLIQHRGWLAWVPGPARLPVESAWVGTLDQMLWIEDGFSVELGNSSSNQIRTLVVIDAAFEQLPEVSADGGLQIAPIRLATPQGERRTAFLVDLPRDEFGRPATDLVLGWCDRHGLPLFRLEPLDRGC